MADDFKVTLDIPDRLPYEGKATLKQKNLIWKLGFTDQPTIDALGKDQASAVIQQLQTAHKEKGDTKNLGCLLLVVALGALGIWYLRQ